jgi:nifR3 family TIM-barrel protein
MREPDLAEALVAAAVKAVDVPVTVKMRLGWDDDSRNAADIARRAVDAGAQAITVHGRTRCQFYKGVADWSAVAAVKAAVSVPVLVNGDIVDGDTARQALRQSGADGVMIGRGVYGRPWIAQAIEAALNGEAFREPDAEERLAIAVTHFRRSLNFYGQDLGLKMFRKHLASYIEAAPWPDSEDARRAARAALCRLEDPAAVEDGLAALWLGDRRLAA